MHQFEQRMTFSVNTNLYFKYGKYFYTNQLIYYTLPTRCAFMHSLRIEPITLMLLVPCYRFRRLENRLFEMFFLSILGSQSHYKVLLVFCMKML